MTQVQAVDPRVKRTRKLLIDAFVELLGEKSFDAITVQDIAARSTVNRATFYSHFLDKYDLFAQFSREWFRGAVDARLPASVFSAESLRRLVLATMSSLAEMLDHCRPTEALKPLIWAAVQEELASLLREWLEPVVQPAELDSTVAALSWAIFGSALQWSQSPERASAEPTAAQLATLLTHGLQRTGPG